MPRACCVHAACIYASAHDEFTMANGSHSFTLHCCGSCEAERAEQRNRLQTQLLEANITNTRMLTGCRLESENCSEDRAISNTKIHLWQVERAINEKRRTAEVGVFRKHGIPAQRWQLRAQAGAHHATTCAGIPIGGEALQKFLVPLWSCDTCRLQELRREFHEREAFDLQGSCPKLFSSAQGKTLLPNYHQQLLVTLRRWHGCGSNVPASEAQALQREGSIAATTTQAQQRSNVGSLQG